MHTEAGLDKMAGDINSRLFGKQAKLADMSLDDLAIEPDELGKSGHTYVQEVREPFYSPAGASVLAG